MSGGNDMKYLVLAVLSLLLAAVFIYVEHREKYVPAVVLKGLASLCFVLLGILGKPASAQPQFAKLVVIGLVLGCIADVLLNLRFVFSKIGQKVFLVGILVFLSGHVLYLAALIPLCKAVWIYLILGLAGTYFLIRWVFQRIEAKKAFKIFGIFYLGAIVLMNCVAVGVLISRPGAWSLMYVIGAVLFLISDIVLILNTFGRESKFTLRITNLSLYYLGQILIALCLQLS